jgi:hypothetical protein
MRMLIDHIPLREAVYEECQIAFFRNIMEPEEPEAEEPRYTTH